MSRTLFAVGRAPVSLCAVGACEPCSKGLACSCSTPCKKTGACTACARRVGAIPGFIEKAEPWPRIEEFDATVRNYGADVGNWASKTPGAEVVAYSVKWNNYYTAWRIWFDVEAADVGFFSNSLFGTKVISGPKLVKYQQLVAEYEELWREGTETFKIATSAAGEAPKPPIDIESGIVDAGSAAADLGKTAAKALEWGLYGVLAFGAVYAALLLYPVIAPAVTGAARKASAA